MKYEYLVYSEPSEQMRGSFKYIFIPNKCWDKLAIKQNWPGI